jgi:hypothetical protein
MSHGVHAVQHEAEHHIQHEQEHGHGHGGGHEEKKDNNKKIALLISIMALFLAFSEMLGKGAQTEGIGYNIEAANLWNFFQAKTIRRTLVETAAQEMTVDQIGAASNDALKAAMAKQIDDWKKNAARYRSEPDTREGSNELMARAKEAEHKRDTSLAKYHHYEVASAALQIGIVLCSAAVITGAIALVWIAMALGLAGIAFMGIAIFAPHAVHLF